MKKSDHRVCDVDEREMAEEAPRRRDNGVFAGIFWLMGIQLIVLIVLSVTLGKINSSIATVGSRLYEFDYFDARAIALDQDLRTIVHAINNLTEVIKNATV